tara:strand:+ start:503 stop:688 length:186 start_codon:yes stop_codon:yes gene_type:complete
LCWGIGGFSLDVVLVVLEAMLRAFDVVDEVVHVQLVIEGLGDRPSSVPVWGMKNDGGSHEM